METNISEATTLGEIANVIGDILLKKTADKSFRSMKLPGNIVKGIVSNISNGDTVTIKVLIKINDSEKDFEEIVIPEAYDDVIWEMKNKEGKVIYVTVPILHKVRDAIYMCFLESLNKK